MNLSFKLPSRRHVFQIHSPTNMLLDRDSLFPVANKPLDNVVQGRKRSCNPAQDTSKGLRHCPIGNDISNTYALKVPLDSAPELPSPSSSPVQLTTLCTDVQLLVVDHLPLVDRVCLGLTCKSMARLILLAAKLSPTEWTPFVDNPYSHLGSCLLSPRLAHGWIPKDRFRFCSWCCKIYTRSPDFWASRGMLEQPLRWSPRIPVGKHQWLLMSKKAKYKYLILRWRDEQSDDGSQAKCIPCSIPPNDKLWYEMIHCPECTANLLALTPPGRPRRHRWAWIETSCIRLVEVVSWYPMAAIELIGHVVSSLARFMTSQLQMRISKGRYILPK